MKMETLIGIGILLIITGFLAVMAGILLQAAKEAEGETKTKGGDRVKFSFVGIIGPFPFGFGNDKNLFITTLVIAMAFMLVAYILLRSGVWR